MRPDAMALTSPVKGQREFLVGGQEFSMPADIGFPRGRTSVLRAGGQKFSGGVPPGPSNAGALGPGSPGLLTVQTGRAARARSRF
jgi:hypothetical protein